MENIPTMKNSYKNSLFSLPFDRQILPFSLQKRMAQEIPM